MTAAHLPDLLRRKGRPVDPRKPPPKGCELIHAAAGIHRRVTWAGRPMTTSFYRGTAIWLGSVIDKGNRLHTVPLSQLSYVGGGR